MNGIYDYKKFAILYVDDEEKSLKYFTMAFEGVFRVYTALDAQQGFRLLEEHADEIALLLTDQRMPGEKGVQFLERARQVRPKILRFLVTAYADMDAAIQAVNTGAIYKYVSKPWNIPELEVTLRRAMEFFIVQAERDALLREKLSVLHNMVITDRVLSLGVLASGLSHHIRNSLVAVRTFLDLAPVSTSQEKAELEALRNPRFWEQFHAHACRQVDRITQLLGTLCLAAEMPPYKFDTAAQPAQVIGQVLAGLQEKAAARKISFLNRLPENLPVIQVDLPKFRRLFELLLEDELESLPGGGAVSLSAQVLPEGTGLEIDVSDNGPGLPEDSLRQVFDPFYLRHDDPKSFGLNLMACYLLVYHHGGSIRVENRKDQGVVFHLRFPANPREAPGGLDENEFLGRVLNNETLWEKLLTGR